MCIACARVKVALESQLNSIFLKKNCLPENLENQILSRKVRSVHISDQVKMQCVCYQFNQSILYLHYSFYRYNRENNINLEEKTILGGIVNSQLENMCVVAEVAKAFM